MGKIWPPSYETNMEDHTMFNSYGRYENQYSQKASEFESEAESESESKIEFESDSEAECEEFESRLDLNFDSNSNLLLNLNPNKYLVVCAQGDFPPSCPLAKR